MRGDRLIAAYVDASLEVATLRRQVEQYPELKSNPVHRANVNAAVVARDASFRKLTGGMMAEAQRRIAAAARIETSATDEETR